MRTFPSLSTCRLLICAHILRDAVNLPARIRKMCALFELGRKCAQMDLPWRGGEARNVRTYQESGLRGREMCAHSPVQRCKRCDSATVRQCDQPTPADPPKNRSRVIARPLTPLPWLHLSFLPSRRPLSRTPTAKSVGRSVPRRTHYLNKPLHTLCNRRCAARKLSGMLLLLYGLLAPLALSLSRAHLPPPTKFLISSVPSVRDAGR